MSLAPPQLHSSWAELLQDQWTQPYMQQLSQFLAQERKQHFVYPSRELVFHALNIAALESVNVVILGQDPYHGVGQAHGLAFSVPNSQKIPPSLKNIFLELHRDVGVPIPEHGCLTSWADQGILLLNSILTVRAHQPLSHKNKGWELFTDAVIKKLWEREEALIFVLWGKSAQEKLALFENQENSHHAILKAAHPSPYSAQGFFGCKHFSKINDLLKKRNKRPIDWSL